MGLSRPRRTLVVEDDPGLREFYSRFFASLEPGEFDAVIVDDAPRALAVLRGETVDLALIDWNLPGISGETLIRAMREHPKTRSIGILMVTARSSSVDEVQALDLGADDYLAKPVDEASLLARLRSLGRRRDRSRERTRPPRVPGLEFDHEAGLVRVGAHHVRLTPKESALLRVFLNAPNILHSRDRLRAELWGYDTERSEELLEAAVWSLKEKLGEAWGARLRRVEGQGYFFEDPR